MAHTFPPEVSAVGVRAHLLANRIELRHFEGPDRLAASPLTLSAGANGCAVLFRYGAVVLAGLTGEEEKHFLGEIAPYLRDVYPAAETEETVVRKLPGSQEGAYGQEIRLADFQLEKIQVVADVLAKSVVLAYYEAKVAASFGKIEILAENLKAAGNPGAHPRELLKSLGETLLVETRVVGRAEVVEKPELVWERPEQERLHNLLAEEYELRERHAILERKLALISRTAETVIGLLRHRSSIRVEWYITILIMFEILLTLYTLSTG